MTILNIVFQALCFIEKLSQNHDSTLLLVASMKLKDALYAQVKGVVPKIFLGATPSGGSSIGAAELQSPQILIAMCMNY